MPSNHTENYQLSQWVKSDQVQMEDFNADNAKIDAAIKAEADALAALEAAKGNCQFWISSYTGTGKCGTNDPNRLNFPWRPAFAMIVAENGFLITVPGNGGSSCLHSGQDLYAHTIFSWSGNTLSWYSNDPTYQMNDSGKQYRVIALYAKS